MRGSLKCQRLSLIGARRSTAFQEGFEDRGHVGAFVSQGPDLGLQFLELPPGACDVLVPSRDMALK